MAMLLPPTSSYSDGSSFFAGTNLVSSSQSIQLPSSPSKKIHWPQSLLPLTVKQIADSYFSSSDDKPNLVVDGIEANFRVLGMVVDKVERETDVSFLIDDGTGRIEISKWISVAMDTVEVAAVEIGMYVEVNGHMKEFQGKKHAFSFSIRPVTDFNYIALHYIECIYIHLENTKLKGAVPTDCPPNAAFSASFSNRVKGYQAPLSNQFLPHSGMVGSGNDIYTIVLGVFQEPSSLVCEHGLHVDEVFRRLRLPQNMILGAINYLVDVGQIYSTIDEYHFKSTISGS